MTEPPQRQHRSPAVEDYLEQIHLLIESKGYARAVDIAANLEVSPASVSNMIRKMDGEGLVVYERYRGVILTERGEGIARGIARRHDILSRLLSHFDIASDTIYRDVEGMEHHVSPETLAAFEALNRELETNPELVKRLRERRVKSDE